MYAVDPIGSFGQSAVQSASVRRDDPALLGEQLTEDQRTMRDTGSKTSTLPRVGARLASYAMPQPLPAKPKRRPHSKPSHLRRASRVPQWASRWNIWSRPTSVISSDIGEPFLRAGRARRLIRLPCLSSSGVI
jgi:hypothetical protein